MKIFAFIKFRDEGINASVARCAGYRNECSLNRVNLTLQAGPVTGPCGDLHAPFFSSA